MQTIWAWITDHVCNSNKIGHANKYYIIGEGRAKIAANISHISESTSIAHSDKSTSFTSVMQSDVSRQFLWPIAFVVHWVGRSDCIVAADVEANFYPDKRQSTGGILVFAVGAGKAAVPIPYWAAKELFENKRDLPVVFECSKALNDAMAGFIYDQSDHYDRIKGSCREHEHNTLLAGRLPIASSQGT